MITLTITVTKKLQLK